MLARRCYPTRHAPCQHLRTSDQPQHLVDLDCRGRRKFTSTRWMRSVPGLHQGFESDLPGSLAYGQAV